MTNRELIEELQRQKSLIGTEIFDEGLLEQYLTLSTIKERKMEESYENNVIVIDIYGIESLRAISNTLDRLGPFELKTKGNGFRQAQAPWITLYTIARKTGDKVPLSISPSSHKQYQKTQIIPFRNENGNYDNYRNAA